MRILAILVGVFILQAPANAAQKKATIVYDKGCGSRYIAETPMGYILLEWFGGSFPQVGDQIVGDLETYGMKDAYNLSRENQTKFWVDEFWLSRDRVLSKLRDKCPNG